MTGGRVGWVIEQYDEATFELARAAAPDFLFGDIERVPGTLARLWSGPWQWALYEVQDLATARRCARLGADFVETMTVRAMLEQYTGARAP